jgi:hypothetical protein
MGITILALLLLLNGVVLAVQVGTLYSHPDIGATFSNAYLRHMFPTNKPDAAGIMLFSAIGAGFSLGIGMGLFFLEDMARWGLIFATGIPLGRQVIGIALALVIKPSALLHRGDAFWFQILALGAIVWYLFQPQVQCAFTGREEYYDAYADVEHNSADKRS